MHHKSGGRFAHLHKSIAINDEVNIFPDSSRIDWIALVKLLKSLARCALRDPFDRPILAFKRDKPRRRCRDQTAVAGKQPREKIQYPRRSKTDG